MVTSISIENGKAAIIHRVNLACTGFTEIDYHGHTAYAKGDNRVILGSHGMVHCFESHGPSMISVEAYTKDAYTTRYFTSLDKAVEWANHAKIRRARKDGDS